MSLAEDIAERDEAGGPSLLAQAPQSVSFKKLRKRLVRQVRHAMDDFSMVADGAKWLVCLSGGKDSYALLAILSDLKWRGLLPVDLLACNLDQGQPGFPRHVLPDFLSFHGVAHRIEYRDTYSIVTDKVPEGATYCALNFPIIPCDLCGSQDGLKRNQIKQMLNEMEARQPGRKETMLKALGRASPSHLLDRELFDFTTI